MDFDKTFYDGYQVQITIFWGDIWPRVRRQVSATLARNRKPIVVQLTWCQRSIVVYNISMLGECDTHCLTQNSRPAHAWVCGSKRGENVPMMMSISLARLHQRRVVIGYWRVENDRHFTPRRWSRVYPLSQWLLHPHPGHDAASQHDVRPLWPRIIFPSV